MKERFSDIKPHHELSAAVPTELTPSAVPVSELEGIMKKVSFNKAVGEDKIPAQVYLFAERRLTVHMALLSGGLEHCYCPDMTMEVPLLPLLKGSLKDRP